MPRHPTTRPTLLWLQGITCNGNAHSFFNHPNLMALLEHFDLLHHPLLPSRYTLEEIATLEHTCDLLIIEGAYTQRSDVVRAGVPIATLIDHYAQHATYIITAGTCATFGGIFKRYDPETIRGFAYDGQTPTPQLAHYRTRLISLPGCPIHPRWLGLVLESIIAHTPLHLDPFQRPTELYGYTVHNGCTRNEYFEWKVDAIDFGHKEGCLFYEQGCQAPYTRGSCNKILWNDTSSKPRVGTPCFGCTEATFPRPEPLYETPTRMGIPVTMPLGVPRRAYLTLTGIAKSFNIKRFKQPITEYADEADDR